MNRDVDEEEEGEDEDGPEEWERDGEDDGGELGTEDCPFCGEEIYEGADVCPKCGNFVAMGEVRRKRPVWFWVGLGLALLVAVLWAVFG